MSSASGQGPAQLPAQTPAGQPSMGASRQAVWRLLLTCCASSTMALMVAMADAASSALGPSSACCSAALQGRGGGGSTGQGSARGRQGDAPVRGGGQGGARGMRQRAAAGGSGSAHHKLFFFSPRSIKAMAFLRLCSPAIRGSPSFSAPTFSADTRPSRSASCSGVRASWCGSGRMWKARSVARHSSRPAPSAASGELKNSYSWKWALGSVTGLRAGGCSGAGRAAGSGTGLGLGNEGRAAGGCGQWRRAVAAACGGEAGGVPRRAPTRHTRSSRRKTRSKFQATACRVQDRRGQGPAAAGMRLMGCPTQPHPATTV